MKTKVHLNFIKGVKNNGIVKLESRINYTIIYFENGSVLISAYTLLRYEEFLKDNCNFLRINRSTILNIHFILEFIYQDNIIILKTNEKHLVSRRRFKNIYNLLVL